MVEGSGHLSSDSSPPEAERRTGRWERGTVATLSAQQRIFNFLCDDADLLGSQFREHGQGKKFFGATFCDWECPTAEPEVAISILQVERNRIMDAAANALLAESFQEGVAIWDAN